VPYLSASVVVITTKRRYIKCMHLYLTFTFDNHGLQKHLQYFASNLMLTHFTLQFFTVAEMCVFTRHCYVFKHAIQ